MRKKMALFLSTCTLLAAPAFAYNIYNNTDHSVLVKDKSGLSGMDVTMAPKSSASCNPKAHGCHGKISFAVASPQAKRTVICTWDGKIDKDKGNYFVITSVAGKSPPQPNSCYVEYYHD